METFGDEAEDAPPIEQAQPGGPTSPESTLTYERFYGLHSKPFSLSPDPRFLFESASHAPVLHDLVAAIRRREGLIVLTGEIGTGKTTLCRSVIERLDQKTFTTFVADPFVTREDLLKTMLIEFGVMSVDDLVKGRLKGASRPDLSFPLYEFLRSLEPLDAFAVLVIDEVQNLSLPLLEEIRILSDLEAGRKLLQVVLVGQPEFDDHLRLPRMRQIQQRVSVHCRLQPLDRDGVTGYVGQRLRTAGATADQVCVLPEALDVVHAASGGVPRVINLLCDKALAHGEARNETIINADLVRLAMADLRMPVPDPSPTPVIAPDPRVVADRVAASVKKDPVVRRPSRALSSSSSLARGKVWLGTRRLPPATVAALTVLGLTTGVSLASYWLWVRPMLLSQIVLPVVGPPVPALGGVGPLVLEPTARSFAGREAVAARPDSSVPPEAVAAGEASEFPWVIQVGVFSGAERSASMVERLESLNYPAFERNTEFAGGERRRVAFAGPYGTRGAAQAALETLRRIPGFESAITRPLAP